MNLHQDFKIVKQVLIEQWWMFNISYFIKLLSLFYQFSSPDEGSLKPKRFNVEFPSK